MYAVFYLLKTMILGMDLTCTIDYVHDSFLVCVVLFRHRPCERLIPRPGSTTKCIFFFKIYYTESMYSMFNDKLQNCSLNLLATEFYI